VPINPEFLRLAIWLGYATLASLLLTLVAFGLGWGVRFRLVGVTSFMVVLAVGSLAFSLGYRERIEIAGSSPYTVVFDSGSDQVVIAVPPSVSADSLEPTLRQAAYNLYSTGRYNPARNQMTIRLRTLIHPQPGVTQPLYLGQVDRSLSQRADADMQLALDPKAIKQLRQYQQAQVS
jgi:hypothetical protein